VVNQCLLCFAKKKFFINLNNKNKPAKAKMVITPLIQMVGIIVSIVFILTAFLVPVGFSISMVTKKSETKKSFLDRNFLNDKTVLKP
jgi:hypothetical protein